MQPWLPARPRVSGTGLPWDGYAGAVQSGPEDADGVVRAGGKVVEVIGALPALEDAEIVAEPWEWHSPRDASLPGGRGVLGGDRGDGKCGDEPAVFMDAEDCKGTGLMKKKNSSQRDTSHKG